MACDTDTVRLGVVGAGAIGKRHVATISQSPESALVGIADPDPAVAPLAAAHDVRRFDTITDLVDAVRPDGVVIATPTERHLQDTAVAIDARLPVLVEKPVAATNEEARRIAERSAASGVPVLIGHHRRYYPVIERARRLVADGTLGKLIGVNGQWSVLKDDAYFAPTYRKLPAAGPVLTNLVHELDSLRVICGEIASVSAEVDHSVRGFAKEDAAAIVLRFASGAVGTFLLSDATPSPWTWEQAIGESPRVPAAGQNTHRFIGTRAALEFPELVLWRQREGETGWHQPIESEPIVTERVDAYVAQCAHFCAVVRGKEMPRVDASDAARTLAATLAVLESAAAGRQVLL